MKQTTFTTDQRNLLQELLKIRLKNYKESIDRNSSDKAGQKRFHNFYVKPLVSALDKITTHDTETYDSKEKLAFISCINEHYDDFYNEMKLKTAFAWLTISDEQRKVVSKLDDCKDILLKCGYYNKKDILIKYDTEFRYGKILSSVDKLKNSSKIFLSKVGHNDYYKIAFVFDNKEYVAFELKHQVSWKDFQFISLGGESPDEVGMKKFSLVTTKPKAKELLATCERQYYPDGVLDFINVLLN